MAWRRPGDKPLSEAMLVYWRIYASSLICCHFLQLVFSLIVPAPLGIPMAGRCLGFNSSTNQLIIVGNCFVSISYDGSTLREDATEKVVCPGDLTDGTTAVLTDTCEFDLQYAYASRGGSPVCVMSLPDFCLTTSGHTHGDTLHFTTNIHTKFTYIYDGLSAMWFLRWKNILVPILITANLALCFEHE